MRVKELVAGQNLVTTTRGTTLGVAAKIMDDEHVTGLPVVDEDGRLEGILSLGVLVSTARRPGVRRPLDPDWHSPVRCKPDRGAWESEPVADAMLRDVVTVNGDDEVGKAARAILDAGVHRAVVVDDDGRPVSVLTSLDFTKLVASEGAGKDES